VTAYVALVAIGNLFLGMVLARIVPPSTLLPHRFAAQPRAGRPQPEPLEQKVEVLNSAVLPAEVIDHGQPAPTEKSDEEKTTARGSAPAVVKNWDDFSHQLSDVKERTHYCRSIQDAQLAEQAAQQLRACAKEWYGQFERCLRGERLDDATQALVEGKSMNAVEMFAAQIETTLSNIDALDFNTSVDDVLNVLERELEMLDRQQKSVGQSQADGGPQT
jgi:hypothetical protein